MYIYFHTQKYLTGVPQNKSRNYLQVSHFERVQAELQSHIPQKHQVPGTY